MTDGSQARAGKSLETTGLDACKFKNECCGTYDLPSITADKFQNLTQLCNLTPSNNSSEALLLAGVPKLRLAGAPKSCLVCMACRVYDLRAKSSASVISESACPDAISAAWDNKDNLVVAQLNNTFTHIEPRRKRTHKPFLIREGDEVRDAAEAWH